MTHPEAKAHIYAPPLSGAFGLSRAIGEVYDEHRKEGRGHHGRIARHRLALVEAYRGRNYRVVATARSVKPSRDPDILGVPGDIADRKTAERLISEGVARFGRIDTLVNNAGVFIAKAFTEYTVRDYATILGVNVTGFFHVTQLAIVEMEKQGGGHVVQITTTWWTTRFLGYAPCSRR